MVEPIPVLTLDYAKPDQAARPAYLRVLELASLVICGVAWVLLAGVDVESVLFTGPVLFLAGAVLLGCGLLNRDRRSVRVGTAHMLICLLFVGAVNVRHWSPGEAELPFTVMGGVYTAAFFGVVIAPWAKQGSRAASIL